eukprot:scaffold226351_cov114-Attheya_sp.AAC.1
MSSWDDVAQMTKLMCKGSSPDISKAFLATCVPTVLSDSTLSPSSNALVASKCCAIPFRDQIHSSKVSSTTDSKSTC